MPALLSVLLIVTPSANEPTRPELRILVGDQLPTDVVARVGPHAFRYGGWVNVLDKGSPTIRYSANSKYLGVTSNAGVYVWEADTGKRLVWVASDKSTATNLIGIAPNGDVLVDCRRKWDDGGAGVFRIDPSTGKVTAKFQPTEDRQFTAISPDGTVVYSFTQGNVFQSEVIADEIDTGKELWRRKYPEMSWMRLSSDGSRIVIWSSRSAWNAAVLDSATGKTVGTFAHKSDHSPSWTNGGVAVGPKAEVVIVAHSSERGFSVFQVGTKEPIWHQAGWWYENAFIADGGKTAVLVRGRGPQQIEVWDLKERKLVSSTEAIVGRTMALSPDGKALAVTNSNPVAFFDVKTGKRLPKLSEPFTQAAVVWYQPDRTLVSADEKFAKPVKWNLKTGKMSPLPAGTKPPAAPKPKERLPGGTKDNVASPDGNRVIGFYLDPDEVDAIPETSFLGLYDGRGRLVKQYTRPDETNGAKCQFTPDSKTFAVARGDGTITLFESETGKELRTFLHGDGVESLAFSPDGRFLATSSRGGSILVWDLQTPKP